MINEKEMAMENSTATTIREDVVALLESKNMSAAALAGATGLGKTAVSLWISEKYSGDNAKIESAMVSWMVAEEYRERNAIGKFPVVETDTVLRIADLAMICRTERKMGVGIGDSGLGKTTAAKKYRHDNIGTLLIEVDMGYTARVLLKVLSEELGLSTKGTAHDLFEGCRKRLEGSGRLIIVDEAEHLPLGALETLRRLHDKADIGVLLIGMPRLLANLRGNKGEFAQLYNRSMMAQKMNVLNIDDSVRIVSSVLSVDTDTHLAFLEYSKGNARRLEMLVRSSRKVADVNGCAVNREVIRTAAEMLL